MIRKAIVEDIDQIEQSYTELLLHEQIYGAFTVWKLGVYPTRKTAEDYLLEDALYVMEQDKEIYASIAINQIQPEEYNEITWRCNAKSNEVLVIHLLCVRPSKSGHGIGKDMVKFVIEKAKKMNCKTIRLDTGSQNEPAVSLYTKLGFEIAGTTSMNIGGIISHKNHLFMELKI